MGAPNIVSGVTRIISHLQTGGGGALLYIIQQQEVFSVPHLNYVKSAPEGMLANDL